MSDTTTNRGVAQAPPSSTGYYLSRDTVLDPDDVLLGNRAIPALDAGAGNVDIAAVVIPDTTPPGCYFIIAAADAGHAVAESREDRNTRGRPIQIRSATGAKLLCADGDFNGDRTADILWRHASGNVVVWLMDDASIAGADSPGSPTLDWTVQGVGDFNGDGTADVLWRHESGPVVIWLMDGTTLVRPDPLAGPPVDWTIQGVADVNGDGRADLVWRHDSGLVSIWLMDGTTIASADSQTTPRLDVTIEGVRDYSGDGRADILWRDATGLVGLWFINGTSVTSNEVATTVGLDWTIQCPISASSRRGHGCAWWR